MQSCKKEKSVNKEGFFWQGTYNTREKTYLKEGALPGSLVDVGTPHAEDILALVHLVQGREHAVCFFFFSTDLRDMSYMCLYGSTKLTTSPKFLRSWISHQPKGYRFCKDSLGS